MAERIVNSDPGVSEAAAKPGQPIQMGIKSDTASVTLASLRVDLAFSNRVHVSGVLPENSNLLLNNGARVAIETSEHRRPITGVTPRSLSSGSILLTKSGTAADQQGIYEVTAPILPGASVLGYFKFRTRTAWHLFNPDWTNLSNVAGPFFGVEHQGFNTGAFAFLRNNGSGGSLAIGGPLQAFNAARGGQQEFPAFDWPSLPNNSVVELFLFFNVPGYGSPFTPADVPLLEVWLKGPDDATPVVLGKIPVGSLGIFPSSNVVNAFPNSRPGVSTNATLYFGNIAQVSSGSDVLQLDDWALYPDYRVAVTEGIARPDHLLQVRPDTLSSFRSDGGVLPDELRIGRWFPITGAFTADPNAQFYFQGGRKSAPLYTTLTKTTADYTAALMKTEPRLLVRADGFMVEAFVSGAPLIIDGEATALGFGVDDGEKTYEVHLLQTPERKTFGILKDRGAFTSSEDGYYVAPETYDFEKLRLLRLIVDRRREKVSLYVDEERVVDTALGGTFPDSDSGPGAVYFGVLGSALATGALNLSYLNYAIRYLAWEGEDTFLPTSGSVDSEVRFTAASVGVTSAVMEDGALRIIKSSTGSSSKYLLSRAQAFSEGTGMFVDFSVKIDSYRDFGGWAFAPNIPSGVTLTVFLGNKKVEVGFYDCGVHGRKVAILPGSGGISDILNQTELGRRYSTSVDWSLQTPYRLVVRGHDVIELTIGATVSAPSIHIPWQDETFGFDLPLDTTQPALVFGHSYADSSGSSLWEYLRWGLSDGFEIALQRDYHGALPTDAASGKAFIRIDFASDATDEDEGGGDLCEFHWHSGEASLATERYRASFAQLLDGSVVVIGGLNGASAFIEDAELFSPDGLTCSVIGPQVEISASNARLCTLVDGRVLRVGGVTTTGDYSLSTEFLDPDSLTWSPTSYLGRTLALHGLVSLSNGNALAMGGGSPDIGSGEALTLVDEYIASEDGWESRPPMNVARADFAVVTLQDDRIMVLGGNSGSFIDSCEIYDRDSDSWTEVASLPGGSRPNAVVLADGRVLIAGGPDSSGNPSDVCAIYDVEEDSWTVLDSLPAAILGSFIFRTHDDLVICLPGTNELDAVTPETQVYQFDPETLAWVTLEERLTPRSMSVAWLVSDCTIQIAGGVSLNEDDDPVFYLSTERSDGS